MERCAAKVVKKQLLTIFLLGLFGAAAAQPEPAANYPARPVRVISGSPGSTADITARFIGQKLSEGFKQQFVIDNRASGGGIVGAEIVANAPADGQTLYVTGVNTQVSAPLLFKKVPFDPLKDFAPISLITNSGLLVVVAPSIGVNNMTEFVAFAKSRLHGLYYASASAGTSSHLTGELQAQ